MYLGFGILLVVWTLFPGANREERDMKVEEDVIEFSTAPLGPPCTRGPNLDMSHVRNKGGRKVYFLHQLRVQERKLNQV